MLPYGGYPQSIKTINKMNRTIIPIITTALILSSCDGSLFGDKVKVFSDRYKAPAIAEGHFAQYGNTMNTDSPESVLGCGYDITESFMSTHGLRGRVIDMDKYTSLDASYSVSTLKVNQRIGDYIYGGSSEELLEAMTAYNGFERSDFPGALLPYSGTFSDFLIYKDEYDYSSAYRFSAFVEGKVNSRVEIDGGTLSLINMKQPELTWAKRFAEEIESGASMRSIIELFGTHIIAGAHLGEFRFDLFRAIPLETEEDMKFEMQDVMHYWKRRIYNDDSVTVPDQAAVLAERQFFAETLASRFNGGDLGVMPGWINGMDSKKWYDTWSDDSYRGFVKLDKSCLLPIYEFVTDPQIKQELKQAVESYMQEKQLKECRTLPLIQITDGVRYDYCTGIDYGTKLTLEYIAGVGGGLKASVIGTVFEKNIPGTKPLYLISDEYGDRLSNEEAENSEVIGYTYDESGPAQISFLYEISDGYHYAYTAVPQDSYSPEGTWIKTGKSIKIRSTI